MMQQLDDKFYYTKERFFKEANEYIDFIHKNGTDFNCDEVNTLLNMEKQKICEKLKGKKIPNFYNVEIKNYLDFIYINGNQENVTDTLDLLFMIMDEIEEGMKIKPSENKTDIMDYRNNVVDTIGNLIMFPVLNKNIGGDDNRAS